MKPFLFNLFFRKPARKYMDRDTFLAVFRSLERRFDACLAEIHKIGADNIDQVIQAVGDEVKAIHARFMEFVGKGIDGIDMEKDVLSKIHDNDTETFCGQWNRVADFVYAFEDMPNIGRDPAVLKDIEEWEKAQINQ